MMILYMPHMRMIIFYTTSDTNFITQICFLWSQSWDLTLPANILMSHVFDVVHGSVIGKVEGEKT